MFAHGVEIDKFWLKAKIEIQIHFLQKELKKNPKRDNQRIIRLTMAHARWVKIMTKIRNSPFNPLVELAEEKIEQLKSKVLYRCGMGGVISFSDFTDLSYILEHPFFGFWKKSYLIQSYLAPWCNFGTL